MRSAEFYQQHDIELRLDCPVINVDINTKKVALTNGEILTYDALLIATGTQPRQLDVPGADLSNVFTLRSFADSDRILAAAQNAQQAVVIGSSFIGMETAAGLTQKGIKVTVVSPGSLPFERILGKEIGELFYKVHQENGVTFKMGRNVSLIEGKSEAQTVVLDNGDRLAADLIVVGIGVQPVTDFIDGIELNPKDRSIPVDEY